MNYDKRGVTEVTVNGTLLPTPSKYSGSLSDLDVDSGRSVNGGKMVRNRIRQGMYKLEFTYQLLTYDVAMKLLDLIDGEFFNVNFFAIDEGKKITKKMYVGDRKFEWTMAIPQGKTEYEIVVTNLTFNFIEE